MNRENASGAGMGRWARRWSLLLPLVLPAAAPAGATAQPTTITIAALEPREALAKLASGEPDAVNAASRVIIAAFRQDEIDDDLIRIGNYDRYTDEQREELLDGVERIARGEVQGNEASVQRARTNAGSIFFVIGLDPTITAPEKREIPRRFLRIYRESQDRSSKAMAVMVLGHLLALSPPETPEIIEALVEVATAAPLRTNSLGHQFYPPYRPQPQAGVDALINGGERGIVVLRRLYKEDAVKEFMARAFLRKYAERGFPPERRGPGPPRR